MPVVELFQNLCQSTNRALETVHAIDEHEVEATKPSIGESALQFRSLQRAARQAVAVPSRELPTFLARDVRAKARVLGFK